MMIDSEERKGERERERESSESKVIDSEEKDAVFGGDREEGPGLGEDQDERRKS